MTKIAVAYTIAAPRYSTELNTTVIALTPGYTTEADIPSIIAIKRGVKPEQVTVHTTVDLSAPAE